MPTLIIKPGTSGVDTLLWEGGNSANNFGVGSFMHAGREGSDRYRSLFYFDLSSIPAGVVITSATLRLGCIAVVSGSSFDVSVHRSIVEWYEGDADGSAPSGDGSTWDLRNYQGSVPWTGGPGGGAGFDYLTTPTDTISIAGTTPNADWDVTADVQVFYAGTNPNLGWWLIGDESSSSSRKQFAAYEWLSGTASERPSLIIQYEESDIAGEVDGSSSAVATAVGAMFLQGDIVGNSAALAVLTAPQIRGVVAGTSDAVATLNANTVGIASGSSLALAELTAGGPMEGIIAGDSTAVATGNFDGNLRGNAFGYGVATAKGRAFAVNVAPRPTLYPAPELYITDGSLKPNGHVNRLDLLSGKGPYCLQEWRPSVVQWKGGGHWSDSPMATGRRPTNRKYANVIETMLLSARATNQDQLIGYVNELIDWLEAAANYHIAGWGNRPVYLVARAQYETMTRYALIYAGRLPELDDVSGQPFAPFHAPEPLFGELGLQIEHGIWQDLPPGQSTPVAVSSYRNYTVTGWT